MMKRNMKKTTVLILCLALLFAPVFGSCSSGADDTSEPGASVYSEPAPGPVSEEISAESAEEPVSEEPSEVISEEFSEEISEDIPEESSAQEISEEESSGPVSEAISEEESSGPPSEEPSEEISFEESIEPVSEPSEIEESREEPSAEESEEAPSAPEESKEESLEESIVEESSEEESFEGSEEGSVEESSEEPRDTDIPVITLQEYTETLWVSRGGEIDVMLGVRGYDETEGDVSSKLAADTGGLDTSVPGEYTVTYSLKDGSGNEAEQVVRKIIVKESALLAEYPVWEGEIANEKLNPANPAVFGGAWYRKVVSSKDSWVGIEATVTLPEVVIRRYDGDYDETLPYDPKVKNLDNPSVYLGGNAGSESDVGLGFSRTLYNANGSTLTVSSYAFRPFWRYITKDNKDAGGYDVHGGLYAVTANGNNCYANYHYKYTEYYYLPGDTLRIIVFSPSPGKLQLQIEVIAKSTLPSSVAIREKYGWKDPADFISPVFSSPGHGTGGVKAEFKRVNAIDQTSNEGKTAIETQTEITNAVWHSTYLYRVINGITYRVPMNDARRGEVNAPRADAFIVERTDEQSAVGGETVTIAPGR